MNATIGLLLETVFYSLRETGYKEDNWGDAVSWEFSSSREAEKRLCFSSVNCSVVGYSPDSNDMSTEAKESPLLRAVTKQWLLKTLQAGEDLACSDL
jgi:hypothetical protein